MRVIPRKPEGTLHGRPLLNGSGIGLLEIESALMNDPSPRYHLDTCLVSRSAVARGNEKLNADFFQERFRLLYTWLQPSGSVPGKRFRFKGKLFCLDGSLIDVRRLRADRALGGRFRHSGQNRGHEVEARSPA
jgi:hypothetical protein